MLNPDFKFDFTLETIVNREDDTSLFRTSNVFKGIARNTPDEPSTVDCTDVDLRVHFVYDGNENHYIYHIFSAKHPFCPAIARGMNAEPKNLIEFSMFENIFEAYTDALEFNDGLTIMINNDDFNYLESIGCFEYVTETED